MYKLWQSPFIQKDIQGAIVGLDDNGLDFFKAMDRISAPDYIPTDEDILKCRLKTESISETIFNIEDTMWHVIDVAGQREKRDKWTVYFDQNVKAIIYIFSAASFNQELSEAHGVNRIVDAMDLLHNLTHHPILSPLSYIIFYNKVDLIPSRLQKCHVKNYLSDYDGA